MGIGHSSMRFSVSWLLLLHIHVLSVSSLLQLHQILSISQANDKHSIDPITLALLTIHPDRIVPTPLHLFLGISNRIILDAFSELFSKELVEETLEKVKTIHSAGCGGKSDLFELNGPEIRKWIKKDCTTALRTGAEKLELSPLIRSLPTLPSSDG
jgi:hypothetical protein